MKILSIANFKGGTGKTTTACNLAALLGWEGKRVLLIDADAQHNATDFFVADPDGYTLTDMLEGLGESVAEDNIVHADRYPIDVLCADMGLLRLDLAAILNQSNATQKRMDDFLDALREDDAYDFVICDCPPQFTAASVACLINSDEVILPTKVDAFSRQGVIELTEQLRAAGLRLLRPMPRIRVLITMADARSSVPRQVAALYRSEGFEVCGTAIRSGVAVSKSTWQRLPLYAVAPMSNPAQDYEALAEEVMGERIATPAGALARNDGEGVC